MPAGCGRSLLPRDDRKIARFSRVFTRIHALDTGPGSPLPCRSKKPQVLDFKGLTAEARHHGFSVCPEVAEVL